MTYRLVSGTMWCRHCGKEITGGNPRVTAGYCHSCESHADFRVPFRTVLASWVYWEAPVP